MYDEPQAPIEEQAVRQELERLAARIEEVVARHLQAQNQIMDRLGFAASQLDALSMLMHLSIRPPNRLRDVEAERLRDQGTILGLISGIREELRAVTAITAGHA